MAIAKAKIISELGERSLLLPELVADALAANARIKFALGWLQAAEAVAGGRSATFNLEAERALAGLSGDPLYDPPGAVVRRGNAVFIPGASRVFSHMMDDLANMQTAVKLGATAANLSSSQLAQFSRRSEAFSGRVTVQDDLVPVGLISSFAAPAQPGRDTFHSLVMDLHKALNSVAVAIAEEEIDGARVFRLGDSDRDRVKAFMRGLNRTAPLKFDHPGLATTSTRDGARLIIQNDVGITSAHVLMAYVEELKISVVYSDIHARRIEFLRRRLDGFKWTVANHPSPEAGGKMLHLATGVLDAPDVRHLDQMLE
ncbi:MAG: hypothetical protein KGO02_12895, partial [Alphaproteobacteria bacterium]|nr:hypothetical protein [Alphaproteobacteria bacterium]